MTTLKAAIERFIDQVRVADKPIAFYDTADSFSAGTTLTHVRRFANSTFGAPQYKGRWLERPTAVSTVNNILKRISSVDTAAGIVTHDGTAYSGDTTQLYYRVWDTDWHPLDYVIPLLNRALEETWQWWREVLSIVPNAGGEDSTVGGTDSSATTTRGTTAASVFVGQAALSILTTGANGYHQYATFDAAAGQPFSLLVWVRGTVTDGFVRLVDQSGATIAEVAGITASGRWTLVQITGQFSTSVTTASLRIGAATSGVTLVADSPALYWGEQTLIEGPSWLTQWRDDMGADNARLLAFKPRLGSTSTPGPGRSYDIELVHQSSYQILNMPSDANPVRLELGHQLWEKGALFIEAKRPFSHFNSTGSDVALALDTATNPVPLRLWVAAAKMLCAEERGLPQMKLWMDQYHDEQRTAQSLLRTPAPDQRGLAWHRGR